MPEHGIAHEEHKAPGAGPTRLTGAASPPRRSPTHQPNSTMGEAAKDDTPKTMKDNIALLLFFVGWYVVMIIMDILVIVGANNGVSDS